MKIHVLGAFRIWHHGYFLAWVFLDISCSVRTHGLKPHALGILSHAEAPIAKGALFFLCDSSLGERQRVLVH